MLDDPICRQESLCKSDQSVAEVVRIVRRKQPTVK
jgi:hypothetical protein